ncbi:D-amino acid dehydrogenase [Marinobacter sp. NFXS9]|uniref:D-amino acid dehydrogenase n=1 Tax=Marinobacter sp. NFXS9 TaxID=2818433 RepID=UPI0032DF29FD
MHMFVLGAGVVGTATAWYLRQAGHDVTVVDRQPRAGLETSYANGGQISVCHAEPWANPATPAKILRWLNRPDAPLRFKPRLDPHQWRWALSFLRECLPSRTEYNLRQIVNLGLYSRAQLQALQASLNLDYDHLTRGILHLYTDQAELEQAREPACRMRELGCQRDVIDLERMLELEPALASARDQLVGATYTADDESGDAHRFTWALAERAEAAGVRFLYNTDIVGIDAEHGDIQGVRVIQDGHHDRLAADGYVLSLGSFSAWLGRSVGLRLPIYPAKGYSITVPVRSREAAYSVSLIDDEYKLVYSRLGDRLRIAGTAELNGYERHLDTMRCQAIVKRAASLMPDAGYWDKAEFWSGLRPLTPSNVPYIGRTRYRNLYLNTGHGSLGWTHACGSASALADIVGGRKPEVDFAFAAG